MSDAQKFLEGALAAVKIAEPVFVRSFGCASGIVQKQDSRQSQVTDSDKEIERVLVQEITSRFPDHAIVGEEGASKTGAIYTWYIDPIDGTTNYIRGIAHCSISVALWDAHGPLVGVVADPVGKVTFTALRGGGAFRNGRPIHASTTSSLTRAVGNLAWDWGDKASRAALINKVEKNAYRWRIFSGSALELCFVAQGSLDFFVSISIHIWDMGAAILILREAGGTVTDVKGEDVTPQSTTVVGTNGKLHRELLAALK